MRSLVTVAASIMLCVLGGAACTDDPSAQFFASTARAHSTPSIDATSGSAADTSAVDTRLLHGGIDRPDPNLTPGVVATADLDAVCRIGKRVHGEFLLRNPMISASNQQLALARYNIQPARAPHYGLDFLVPLQLGGANTIANIWPVSTTHGVGFREKEILNIRLHVLVCQRQMPLDQAQRAVASDWVKLWLKIG